MKINIQDVNGILAHPSPPPAPRKLSGREVALRNELAVLSVIRDYGHLRTAEIASAVWPGARYRDQLAQRTLRRLLAQGEVLQRVNTLATRSWVLASAGVARLELFGADARHGRDIVGVAGATFIHRTLASAYLIYRAGMAAQTTYGEYAIAHGRAPMSRQGLSKRFGKLPDGLVVRGSVVDWVEVEASAKSLEELKNVLRAAEWVGQPLVPGGPLTIGGLTIVFDRRQDHARRILRAARERWGHLSRQDQEKLCSRVTLAFASVSGPLRIEEFAELRLNEYR